MARVNILVTAGPTREPIDPVRFISNRSSGKMGYAMARVAAARGHAVRLVSGPVALTPPAGVETTSVTTAAEMLAAVSEQIAWCDALIMAAAVADWRPARPAAHKLKKHAAQAVLVLEPTADILLTVRPLKGSRLFIGFAAETGDAEAEARRKLTAKGLDLVVANDVTQAGAGFDVDTNVVTLITADGAARPTGVESKDAVALRIVAWVESAWLGRAGADALTPPWQSTA